MKGEFEHGVSARQDFVDFATQGGLGWLGPRRVRKSSEDIRAIDLEVVFPLTADDNDGLELRGTKFERRVANRGDVVADDRQPCRLRGCSIGSGPAGTPSVDVHRLHVGAVLR